MGMIFSAPRTMISLKAICKNPDFYFHYPEYKKKCEGEK